MDGKRKLNLSGREKIFRRWIHWADCCLCVQCWLLQKYVCTCMLVLESLPKIILFALGFAFCYNVIILEELVPNYIIYLKQCDKSMAELLISN